MRRIALSLLVLSACDPAPNKAERSGPYVEVIVGNQKLRAGYDSVECSDHYTFKRGDDIVLQAFLRPGEEVSSNSPTNAGAVVYLKKVDIQGRNYDVMMLTGMPVENVPSNLACGLIRKGDGLELTCNNVAVRPWLDPTAVPNGAFRATFQCIN